MMKSARILAGLAIVALAAFPVRADPAPAPPIAFSPSDGLTTVILDELKFQGLLWMQSQVELKDAQALTVKFKDPAHSKTVVPQGFLKSAWPVAMESKDGDEPPYGRLMFVDQTPKDLRNKDPHEWLTQFSRYLGSLGIRNQGGRYIEAAAASDKEADAVGGVLQGYFGGQVKAWQTASRAARNGAKKLVARALSRLVGFLKDEAKNLAVAKETHTDEDLVARSAILALVRNLHPTDSLHDVLQTLDYGVHGAVVKPVNSRETKDDAKKSQKH